MNIIAQNREFTKQELYKMTRNENAVGMKEYQETTISVDDYIIFERPNYNGEINTVACIRTGDIYLVTNSKSFVNEFIEITDIFGEEIPNLEIIHGKSNKGREFITVGVA